MQKPPVYNEKPHRKFFGSESERKSDLICYNVSKEKQKLQTHSHTFCNFCCKKTVHFNYHFDEDCIPDCLLWAYTGKNTLQFQQRSAFSLDRMKDTQPHPPHLCVCIWMWRSHFWKSMRTRWNSAWGTKHCIRIKASFFLYNTCKRVLSLLYVNKTYLWFSFYRTNLSGRNPANCFLLIFGASMCVDKCLLKSHGARNENQIDINSEIVVK